MGGIKEDQNNSGVALTAIQNRDQQAFPQGALNLYG